MATGAEDWAGLATQVRVRMKSLGLTQQEVQQRGGPSPAKLREILNERSQVLSPSLRRGLEHALKWPTGSIAKTLEGHPPIRAADNETPEIPGPPADPDEEFIAMQQVTNAIATLDLPARRRVLAWALDRCETAISVDPSAL